MKILKRNARFIVPLPWLMLSALKLWSAAHTGLVVDYVASFAFALLAGLFYFGQLLVHRKRQAEVV